MEYLIKVVIWALVWNSVNLLGIFNEPSKLDFYNLLVPPQMSDGDACFISSKGFTGELPHNCSKLVISINLHNPYLNLDFLWENLSVEELWVRYEKSSKEGHQGCQNGEVAIRFTGKRFSNIGLKRLHINVKINISDYNLTITSLPSLRSLITNSKYLQVLNLGGSWSWRWRFNVSKTFNQIFKEINREHLRILLFKQVLDRSSAEAVNFNLDLRDLFHQVSFQSLEYFDISGNNLVSITGSVAKFAPNLKVFAASDNMLTSTQSLPTFIELIILHRSIEVISVENQYLPNGISDCMIEKKSKRFKRRIMTKFSVLFKVNRCFLKYNKTINDLLTLPKDTMCALVKCFLYRTIYDISDLPCNILPSATEAAQYIALSGPCTPGFIIPLAPNLQEITLEYLSFHASIESLTRDYHYCFSKKNNLKRISARHLSPKEHGWLKYISIEGLEIVSSLNMNDNKMKVNFTNNFFQSFPLLSEIHLAYNLLDFSNTRSLNDVSTVIKFIDISYNNLSEADIPPSLIRDVNSLNSLVMAGNKMSQLDLDFRNAPNLSSVNISFNRIQYMTQRTISTLKNWNGTESLSIDLSENVLSCSCKVESLETIEFIQSSLRYNIDFVDKNKYMCTDDTGSKFVHDFDISALKAKCHPSYANIIAIVVSSNIVIVVAIVTTFMLKKYRYRIYTFYFRLATKKRTEQSDFPYDCFISYCAEDRFWVHNILMKELECKYGFKLCVHYRDFAFGDIADVILENIIWSRCVIVILSENSLKSHWCDFELKVAHEQSLRLNKKLIIIKLGNIRSNCINDMPLVKQLLDSRVYIGWPEHQLTYVEDINEGPVIRDKKRLFWARVSNTLYNKPLNGSVFPCFRIGYKQIDNVASEHSPEQEYSDNLPQNLV